jgi:hypothetical protein
MATILCWLSPMYVPWSVLFQIFTIFCRPQLRVVFLSGQDSQGCGDLERDQTSRSIMDIPVGHTNMQMIMETQNTFRFFVRMTSNLEANVDRATMLLGPAVEACMSEVDEYSVPNQQKV